MERGIFIENLKKAEKDGILSEKQIRDHIHKNADREKDMPVCIGELSELILELTRYQRGKMDMDDFLQELSHVQWAVWSLQDSFGVTDEKVRAAVQASFRNP